MSVFKCPKCDHVELRNEHGAGEMWQHIHENHDEIFITTSRAEW